MESILAAREPDKTLRNSSLIDFCYIKRRIRTNLGNLILVMLKSLGWIRLIERSTKGDASGGYSHAAGLDLSVFSAALPHTNRPAELQQVREQCH